MTAKWFSLIYIAVKYKLYQIGAVPSKVLIKKPLPEQQAMPSSMAKQAATDDVPSYNDLYWQEFPRKPNSLHMFKARNLRKSGQKSSL